MFARSLPTQQTGDLLPCSDFITPPWFGTCSYTRTYRCSSYFDMLNTGGAIVMRLPFVGPAFDIFSLQYRGYMNQGLEGKTNS